MHIYNESYLIDEYTTDDWDALVNTPITEAVIVLHDNKSFISTRGLFERITNKDRTKTTYFWEIEDKKDTYGENFLD